MSLRFAAILMAVGFASPVLGVVQFNRVVAPNSGLASPIFLTSPANDSRLFVVERAGRIRIIQNGVLQASSYLDISSKVNTSGERGLLGLAFAPDFATSGNFYVNYINNTNFNTTVERYTATPASNTANTTGTLVFSAAQPSGVDNHKAGWIGFRPGDGNNLYIATGDGGGSNDTSNNSQNLSSPLGKIHRINPLGASANTPAAGNPFAGGATSADDTVWAYGLRNPFRNSFDRANGNFFIADVGQSAREEVNVEEFSLGGRNYGWRTREGFIQTPAYPIATNPIPANAVDPVFDYARNSTFTGSSASITGGYVYRGTVASDLIGQYIFADYTSGRIGAFTYNPATDSVSGVTNLTPQLDPTGTLFGGFRLASFGEDSSGNLYALNLSNGAVYVVVPEPSVLAVFTPLAALMTRRRR